MNIKQQLNIRLSQNLVMTQSLQQAIKLLQLSKLELESLIRKELEENPVLEEVTNETAPSTDELVTQAKESTTSEVDSDKSNSMDEIEYDYFYDDYVEYQHRRSLREEVELPAFDSTLAQPTHLADHLSWQLNLSFTDEKKLAIGNAIIGNLNEDGYLKADISEIAALTESTEDEVEEVRKVIQVFDPIGVASTNLQDCLRIQLLQLDEDVDLPLKIIDEHMGYLEKHAYEELAKKLGCTLDTIQKSLAIIRSLDPKPGSKYNFKGPVYIEPDVFIIRDGDDYKIILNEDNLPQLRINSSYQRLLAKDARTKDNTKNFIRERITSAKWLLKSFMQRQQTIYKVVESIAKKQKEFLDKGVEYLKPMILSDVAP